MGDKGRNRIKTIYNVIVVYILLIVVDFFLLIYILYIIFNAKINIKFPALLILKSNIGLFLKNHEFR